MFFSIIKSDMIASGMRHSLSFSSGTVAQNFMTIIIASGLWRHRSSVYADATIEQTHEQVLPYYEDHNELHEATAHLHEDGWCDCNAQGPWHPLFKGSQTLQHEDISDSSSAQSVENAIDVPDPHHHPPPAEANDLFSNGHTNPRKAKKQNHMIHLHLIPHIYVPVLHPVRHPVTYSLQPEHNFGEHENHHHPYTFEQTDSENLSTEHDNEIRSDNSGEHTSFQNPHSSYIPTPQHSHHLPPEAGPSDQHAEEPSSFDSSHESAEGPSYTLPPSNDYPYPQQPEDDLPHQYQVREEPYTDHYYDEFATGSNNKAQVVPPNANLSYVKLKNKLKQFEKVQLNKKFTSLPLSTRRLRVMRPPPPAQVETWRTNFVPQSETKLFPFPIKPFFDSPPFFPGKFFDYKSFFMPHKPVQPFKAMFPIPNHLVKPTVNYQMQHHHQTPILMYPPNGNTNPVQKRKDKTLKH